MLNSSNGATGIFGETNFIGLMKQLWFLVRAHEWWHYKFPVALAVVFSLAWSNSVSAHLVILPTLLIIVAGSAAAIYASVFNDFIDMDQDRAAGKTTPLMTLPKSLRWLTLLSSIALNISVCFLLFGLKSAFCVFLIIWLNYTLYSLPPFRLKERGALGVLAIAIGEHLLAGLLAVFIFAEFISLTLDPVWLFSVLAWSLCFGCRGIIWHQLADIKNDIQSNCVTFGVQVGETTLKRIGEFFIYPVEIGCFTIMLLSVNCPLSWVFLAVYCFTEYLRITKMDINLIIVDPAKNARFVMFEYYQIFFPLSFLFSGLTKDPGYVIVIALFLLFFAAPVALSVNHWNHLFKWLVAVPVASKYGLRNAVIKTTEKKQREKVEV